MNKADFCLLFLHQSVNTESEIQFKSNYIFKNTTISDKTYY